MAALAQLRSARHSIAMNRVLAQIEQRRRTVVQTPKPLPDSVVTVVERAFADHVREQLEGPVLRYSDRLRLLQAAERLRINRFRANLIIAMVQHDGASPVRMNAVRILPTAGWPLGLTVGGFLLLEAIGLFALVKFISL